MDIPQLLRAAKVDLDHLSMIYQRYPDMDFRTYSPEDRKTVKALQANLKNYEAVLRQMQGQGSKVTYAEPSRAFETLIR
jgi:hypothetical protein